MRIALFSNLFPPLFLGGYELGAAQVAETLKRRGHDVRILSSHHYFLQQPKRYRQARHDRATRASILDTGLCVFGSMAHLIRQRPHEVATGLMRTFFARRRYRLTLQAFRPELFLLFNPLGVTAPVIDDCVKMGRELQVPVAAYVSDHWLTEWPNAHPFWYLLRRIRQRGGYLAALADGLLCRLMMRARQLPDLNPGCTHYFYCSDFIRRVSAGRTNPRAIHRVLPWGLPPLPKTPLKEFENEDETEAAKLPRFDGHGSLSIVHAGQLVEHKGLAVLLRALARSRRPHRLTVIGDDRTEYATHCKLLADKLGIGQRVRFLGKKSHEEMPELLARKHVLVVPSLWDEPFSIVVLEGMRAGLVVVASDTGGTPEAIEDGVTGFLFPRGDDERLASIITRLEADRALCKTIATEARQVARERYSLDQMVDQMLAIVPPALAIPKFVPARAA